MNEYITVKLAPTQVHALLIVGTSVGLYTHEVNWRTDIM